MTLTKKTIRSGPYADFFCQAVQAGNQITLAGQVGMAADGSIPENLVEQAVNVYASIHALLSELGATMDNIVDEVMFVTDMGEAMTQAGPLFAAREKAYGKKPEVSQTMVAVAALVDPSMKIEVKVTAIV